MAIEFIKQKFKKQESGTQYRTLTQILHLDLPLLFGIFALVIFGFFILAAASRGQETIVIQKIFYTVFAFMLLFLAAQIPPYFYERWAPFLYSLGVLLLIIVFFVGRLERSVLRWIDLGLFKFQPSELMKIALPLMLAWYFSHRNLPPKLKEIFITLLLIVIPTILTAKEPDLGTAIVLAIAGLCVFYFAGISWKLIIGSIAMLAAFTPILWHFLHHYQKERILIFLNPEHDPLGSGYHIIQSKIAIGSGGFLGKGFLHGTQSHLHFLPEHTTDFIFAVCGEEFGLVGCAVLLLLYLYITLCCVRIAYYAQDTFTRLLAGSLSLLFFFSVFVNIGMVCGALPVVGVPLPLISYGGSSTIATMIGFGILMSIHCHRKLWNK